MENAQAVSAEKSGVRRKQIGDRSKRARLWIAALVIADQKKQPIGEVQAALVNALGSTLKPSDINGAQQFQKLYEETVQRGRDFSRRFAGGLDLNDPVVVRMMTGMATEDKDDPAAAPKSSTLPEAEDEHAIPEPVVEELSLDYLFDDWPLDGEVAAAADVGPVEPLQQALNAYTRKIVQSAKVPTVPYCRPDLGVTFFPTGRFEVADTDWNYNGQIEGEMISDCNGTHLLYREGAPIKVALDFKDWALSKTQRASGVVWIWAVKHVDGKSMRFWLNDGDDQLKFYYTMNATGVRLVRKQPTAPGSRKFEKLDERNVLPLNLEGAPPLPK